MKFPLNGKEVEPKVTVGLAFALTEIEGISQNDMIIKMLEYSIGMSKKQVESLPLECMPELTEIVQYVSSKLEAK